MVNEPDSGNPPGDSVQDDGGLGLRRQLMVREHPLELSIVCAVFNEGEGVREFVERLDAVCRALNVSYELVLVDDGSSDNTLDELTHLTQIVPCLRAVQLYRNVGQVAALSAGMSIARGAWLLMMDGDFQHAPEDIPRFLEKSREGFDFVASFRVNRKDSRRRRVITWVGNRVNRLLTGLDIRDFGSAFRLFHSGILEMLRDDRGCIHYNTPRLFMLAQRMTYISVQHHRREYGQSKWTLKQFIAFNMDFISASDRLVHILFAMSGLGFVAGIVLYLFKLLGISENVAAMSAPVSIALNSLLLIMIAVVWRESIEAQRSARGFPAFLIQRIIEKE